MLCASGAQYPVSVGVFMLCVPLAHSIRLAIASFTPATSSGSRLCVHNEKVCKNQTPTPISKPCRAAEIQCELLSPWCESGAELVSVCGRDAAAPGLPSGRGRASQSCCLNIVFFNSHTVLCATWFSVTQAALEMQRAGPDIVISTMINQGRIPAQHASRIPHHASRTRKWPRSRRLRLELGWVPLALAGRLIAVVRLAGVRILRRVPSGWQL